MRRTLLLALALLLASALPAAAHRLKLFATVEDGTITGYAFFIGGGRPQGSTIVIRDGAGTEVFRTATDDEGRFAWTPAGPDRFTVTVDARDGHAAETVLEADRFGGPPVPGAPAAAPPAFPLGASPSAATEAGLIEAAVDRAVARQIRPLLEAYDAAEGRARFNDVMGGIGMIVGLAGIALWASGHRRKDR